MKIKGEEFIPLDDVINAHYSVVDEMCFDELGRKIGKIAIHIDEEKLKKWVHQAKFIESFSAENIIDIVTRDMVYSLQKENKVLNKALELACLAISKAMCPNGDWNVLKTDFANAYKEQAKEMIDGRNGH